MAKKQIKLTGKTLKRVRDTSTQPKQIDSERVARALGAEPMAQSLPHPASAPMLFAIRQELARRLLSTGGRPRLKDTTRRQKIPMQQEDWNRLEQLSSQLSDHNLKASPGQVASVIIHQALKKVTASQIGGALEDTTEQ